MLDNAKCAVQVHNHKYLAIQTTSSGPVSTSCPLYMSLKYMYIQIMIFMMPHPSKSAIICHQNQQTCRYYEYYSRSLFNILSSRDSFIYSCIAKDNNIHVYSKS